MSRKGSYLGGHTVMTQRRSDFEAELARKALVAARRATRAQTEFDQGREVERLQILQKLERANRRK